VALCAQPFDWLTLVEVSKTLLLPFADFKGGGGGGECPLYSDRQLRHRASHSRRRRIEGG